MKSDTFKYCPKCQRQLPVSGFWKNTKTRDGLQAQCKTCMNLASKRYSRTAKGRQRDRRYWQSEKGKANNHRAGKKYRLTHPEKIKTITRNTNLRRSYGITIEEYNALFELQQGRCAICGRPEPDKMRGRIRRLAVDHCHVTGHVRGLLCAMCNRGIGCLQNNPDILRKAICYIRKSN